MSEHDFIGYEYQDITAKRCMAAVYTDGYENFGWKLEEMYETPGKVDSVSMKFKRDRKIQNKTELTRLQHQFNTAVSEILSLETSKRVKASAVAYGVGIVGTAFMAASVFSVTAGRVVPCIIFAIPAFIGWVVPYLLYRKLEKEKTVEVSPLIDRKYDEIYSVCRKANELLG